MIMTRHSPTSTMILPTTISDTSPSSSQGCSLKRRVSAGGSSSSQDLYHPEPTHFCNGRPPSPRAFGRTSSYSSKREAGWSTWFLVLIAISMGGALLYSKHQHDRLRIDLVQLQEDRDLLNKNQGQLLLQLEQSHRKTSRAPKADVEWLEKIEELHRETRRLENRVRLEKQEKEDKQLSVQKLHESMKSMAERSVVEKFGEGPHYVQFELNMPTGNGQRSREFFTVELAPTNLMPVSVYTFLQQTSQMLWDYTSFYLNADHVMMARPVSLNGQFSKRPQFDEHHLAHVPFQEYHDDFPHVQYTLGFSGKPAGPDIYINMDNNSIPHGPRGHQHSGDAEPCFAKIIVGNDVIDRMAKLPGKADQPAMLAEPVEIVAARVIKNLNEAHGYKARS